MNIFSSGFDKLESALSVSSAKHTVISSNIANVDTPGYKAKEINFTNAFKDALQGTGLSMKRSVDDHFSGMSLPGSPTAHVTDQINNFMRNDGNNVNVDHEMMSLSKNNIMYNMAAQLIGNKFNNLKYVISEGRRG